MHRLVPLAPLLATIALGGAAERPGSVYATFDNDLIAGSDDGYTSGFQVGWVSPHLASFADGAIPGAVGSALDDLASFDRPGARRFVAYSLAQRMFTPEDLAREDLAAEDQPYVGLLAFSATAAAQDRRFLDALTLTVGIAGPSSLAEPVQRGIHGALGSDQPRGWRNQIRDEPLLNLQVERRWRAWEFPGGDVLLSGAASAGNLQSMATVGVGLRWGLDVPRDWFLPPPFFGEETVGSLPWDDADRARPALYVALSVDATLLGNVIYLDGNTVRESHRVDHDHAMARAHLGVHARLGRAAIAVSVVQASIPWDHPDGERWERYGRLSLAWEL